MLAAKEAVERVVVVLGVAAADEGARQVRPAPDAVADVGADRLEIEGEAVLDELPPRKRCSPSG